MCVCRWAGGGGGGGGVGVGGGGGHTQLCKLLYSYMKSATKTGL